MHSCQLLTTILKSTKRIDWDEMIHKVLYL